MRYKTEQRELEEERLRVQWDYIVVDGIVERRGLREHKPTSTVAKWLVRFDGLSLLSANEVEVAFVEDVVSDMPDDERFRKFADYVVENYLDAGCDFPPTLWAESPDLNPATTNGCESHHAHLNAELYSVQLNQTFTCLLRRYCDNRHPRTFLWRHFHSHGKFARTGQRSLRCMYTDYHAGHLSRKEYLQRVSYRFCRA